MNPDGSPASGVAVVVHPGQMRGITGASGRARIPVDARTTTHRLEITVGL